MNIAIKHLFNFETLNGPRLNELTAYIYNTVYKTSTTVVSVDSCFWL